MVVCSLFDYYGCFVSVRHIISVSGCLLIRNAIVLISMQISAFVLLIFIGQNVHYVNVDNVIAINKTIFEYC